MVQLLQWLSILDGAGCTLLCVNAKPWGELFVKLIRMHFAVEAPSTKQCRNPGTTNTAPSTSCSSLVGAKSVAPSISTRYRGPNVPLHLLAFPYLSLKALRCFSTSSRPHQKVQPSSVSANKGLPHLTPQSNVHQVSVSDKAVTFRRAIAIGHVVFSNPEPYRLICDHSLKKGDVLAVARVAAIMAVKKTGDFIPLAHGGVAVEGCVVDLEVVTPCETDRDAVEVAAANKHPTFNTVAKQAPTDSVEDEAKMLSVPVGSFGGIRIAVSVSTTAKTGIEMEALTGVAGAGLTVIDMCKAVDRHLGLEGVRVIGKSGGKSGAWGIYSQDKDE